MNELTVWLLAKGIVTKSSEKISFKRKYLKWNTEEGIFSVATFVDFPVYIVHKIPGIFLARNLSWCPESYCNKRLPWN